MKRITILTILGLMGLATFSALYVFASNCGDTWQHKGDSATPCFPNPWKKTSKWTIYWVDGYERTVDVTDSGHCGDDTCYPEFQYPYWSRNSSGFGQWNQKTRTSVRNPTTGACELQNPPNDHFHAHACQISDGECEWCEPWQTCRNTGCFSPVVIDTLGDGFDLTDAATGVDFDLAATGRRIRISWTVANSDDAWLALDHNANGAVDNGAELFGNFTPQSEPPPGTERNGFWALGEYDKPVNGGNGDGVIDHGDSVYASLRLWQDGNHNGISEPHELHSLPALGVASISLDYRASQKKDRHGNEFRYRAKVNGRGHSDTGKWAYDVFLLSE